MHSRHWRTALNRLSRFIRDPRRLALLVMFFAAINYSAMAADANALPSGNPERVVVNAPIPNDLSADVMAGIDGVYLVLEPFSRDFAAWKRGPEQIAEHVRAYLTRAGVPQLSKAAYAAQPNAAALVLALRVNVNSYGYSSYAWQLVVTDKAQLTNQNSWLARPLWSTGANGVLVPGDFRAFDANLDSTLAHFVSAYENRNQK